MRLVSKSSILALLAMFCFIAMLASAVQGQSRRGLRRSQASADAIDESGNASPTEDQTPVAQAPRRRHQIRRPEPEEDEQAPGNNGADEEADFQPSRARANNRRRSQNRNSNDDYSDEVDQRPARRRPSRRNNQGRANRNNNNNFNFNGLQDNFPSAAFGGGFGAAIGGNGRGSRGGNAAGFGAGFAQASGSNALAAGFGGGSVNGGGSSNRKYDDDEDDDYEPSRSHNRRRNAYRD